MLSVLIPVFRESSHVDSLLSKVLSENVDKEVLVSIDEPTERSRKLMKKYSKSVRFIINEERVGKARALNDAISESKGDILLFLDSDIELISKNSLAKVVKNMEGADVLDFKKTIIRSSRIASLVNYEFMASNVLTTVFSKMGKCLGFNGIAFAIRRQAMLDVGCFKEDAVVEDLELGIQCYLKDKVYRYANDIEIATESKDSWKDWYVQRKRWNTATPSSSSRTGRTWQGHR
jgi:cellulose synthase/poly-beta-1,6-N-acetylglucosamine synthase-like glycosyltransferase